MDADIIIVGSGIAGISSAYFLKEAGYKVIVLEKNTISSGATGQSTGVLWYGSGLNLVPSIKNFGKVKATKLWLETDKSIKQIKSLIERNDIDCELRSPSGIMCARNSKEDRFLQRELKAMKKIGLTAKFLDAEKLKEFYFSNIFTSGLMEECSQIRPLKFVTNLSRVMKIDVWENSPMLGYEERNGKILVKTNRKKNITCEKLIVATNNKPFLGFEKFFVNEGTIALYSQFLGKKIENVFPQEKIFWMLDDLYDMIYPLDGRAVLELFRFKEVKEKLAHYYPSINFKIEKRRFGNWAKSNDTLPIFGKVSKNVIAEIAMGDQGIVMGFTCGRKVLDVIENRKDDFLEMTKPSRFQKLKK